MRIVIEHDPLSTATTVSVPFSETPAENGGPAPEFETASDRPAADNAGAPPQWLLDAVTRAMETEGFAPGTTAADAIDGGSASE